MRALAAFAVTLLAGALLSCQEAPPAAPAPDPTAPADGKPHFLPVSDPPFTPDDGAPNFFDVWGSSESDVWVVGQGGVAAHWDGSRWSKENTGVTADLKSVWGDAATGDLWAVGTGGTIVHRTSTGWMSEASGTTADLNAIRGGSERHIAVGTGGTAVENRGAGWQVSSAGTVEQLNGLWTTQTGAAACAVGNLGAIVRVWDMAAGWNRQRVDGLTVPLRSVWGASDDASDLWAVGLDGKLLHLGGDTASELEGAPQVFLRDVWGTANDDIWMVGWGGVVARFDGTEVTVVEDVSDRRLEGIWGVRLEPPTRDGPDGGTVPNTRYFIVGVNGTILQGP